MDMSDLNQMKKMVLLLLGWVVFGLCLYGLIRAISWVKAADINAYEFNYYIMLGSIGAAVTLSLLVLGALAHLVYDWRHYAKAEATKRARWKAKAAKTSTNANA